MQAEVASARASRMFGEYAADARARERLHTAEQARVGGAKQRDQQMADSSEYTQVPPPGQYLTTASKEGHTLVHARHLAGLKFDVDMTSLGGPPTAHERLTVVA